MLGPNLYNIYDYAFHIKHMESFFRKELNYANSRDDEKLTNGRELCCQIFQLLTIIRKRDLF